MCNLINTYIHTYIHTYVHTRGYVQFNKYIHTYIYIQTYIHIDGDHTFTYIPGTINRYVEVEH